MTELSFNYVTLCEVGRVAGAMVGDAKGETSMSLRKTAPRLYGTMFALARDQDPGSTEGPDPTDRYDVSVAIFEQSLEFLRDRLNPDDFETMEQMLVGDIDQGERSAQISKLNDRQQATDALHRHAQTERAFHSRFPMAQRNVRML